MSNEPEILDKTLRLAFLHWQIDGTEDLTIDEIDLLIKELERSHHVAWLMGHQFWLAEHGYTVKISLLSAAKFLLKKKEKND